MLRWLFTILATLSLILALVTAGMWVRGRFVADQFVIVWAEPSRVDAAGLPDWRGPLSYTEWMITLGDGGILVLHTISSPTDYHADAPPSQAVHRRWERYALISDHAHQGRPAASERMLGFGRWERLELASPGFGSASVLVPYWAVLLLWLVLPAVWIARFIRHRRLVKSGHCPGCGYDLRASTDRCPECGRAIVVDAQVRGRSNS